MLVAELLCGLAHQVDEPAGGARLALDVEILVADHVGEDEGLDAAEGSVAAPFGGQVTAADRSSRMRDQLLNGLFAVEEDQPDGVAVELFAAQFHVSRSPMAISRPVVAAPSLAPTKLMLRSG